MKIFVSCILSLLGVLGSHAQSTGEPFSVVWPLAEGTLTSGATVSNESYVQACSWDAGTLPVDARSYEDTNYTAFSGGTDGTGGYVPVAFTFTPANGYVFIPGQISFKAIKFGSDNCFARVEFTYGDGTTEVLAELTDKTSIGRNNGNPAPMTYTYGLDEARLSDAPVVLTIYLNIAKNNKAVGLADVSIAGSVEKTIAVNIAAGNPRYGAVSTSATTLLGEQEVTITATPRKGCQFDNWTDEAGTVVSTEAVYTFVPTTDVNYTANFSIAEGYAEKLFADEPMSIAWPFSDIENLNVVNFTRHTVFEYSVTKGGDSSLEEFAYEDEDYAVFRGGEETMPESLVFSFTPSEGLVFKPMQVSFGAFQIGSTHCTITPYFIYSDGSETQISDAITDMMSPDNTANTSDVRTYTIALDQTKAGDAPVALRLQLNIATRKAIAINNVVISGEMSGNTFINEYHIKVAANNNDYGQAYASLDDIQIGSNVILTARPNRGFKFVNWTDDEAEGAVVSEEAMFTFVPESDISYTAHFEPLNEYVVNIGANIEGAGTVSITTFEDNKYYEGDVVNIEARPGDGYVFEKWDDGLQNWKRQIVVDKDYTLTAHFEAIPEFLAIVNCPLTEDTSVTTTEDLSATYQLTGGTDTEELKAVNGTSLRLFKVDEKDSACRLTFSVMSEKEGYDFVLRSIEFDAVRVDTDFGNIDILVDGNDGEEIPSAGTPGNKDVSHYYYNLHNTAQTTSATIQFTCNPEARYGFANIKIQGYLKDRATVGISDTFILAGSSNGSFNLNGQRLSRPAKGINITNGKKVVVK